MSTPRPFSPAAERNRGPILEVLRAVLATQVEVLEIGAGTGQHADYFTGECSGWTWWPTNSPTEFDTLRFGLEGIVRSNLRDAEPLDVFGGWPDRRFDAVYSANTAHILPPAGVRALFSGAAAVLRPTGRLILYGPFSRNGVHVAESNARFDADLASRDPGMGVRDLADIDRWAADAGLWRIAEFTMPSNNLTLVFEPGNAADED